MYKIQKIFFFLLVSVFAVSGCTGDDPVDDPHRPGTEDPNHGGNKDDQGDEKEPAPVVTFSDVSVTDIAYNKATLSVAYTIDNLKESDKARVYCRLCEQSGLLDESLYADNALNLSGQYTLELNLYQQTHYYLRVDIEVRGQVFKSEVVDFTTPEKPYIAVAGITLSHTTMKLKVGDKEPLYATIMPADANNKSVYWTYSDKEIANSYNGVITIPATGDRSTVVEALKPGTMTICAETVEGGYKAECQVIVE